MTEFLIFVQFIAIFALVAILAFLAGAEWAQGEITEAVRRAAGEDRRG